MILIKSFLILLYCNISIALGIETIWKTTSWTAANGNISCNNIESDCIIQCNGQYSCGSSDESSLIKPYIICPQNGNSCIINCNDPNSCSNNVILSGNCQYVEINIQNKPNHKMIINAPSNGDLYINVNSNESIFNDNIINSHSTNNIILNCNGKGECKHNRINAESVEQFLNISCSNGNNCNRQEIHCPDNNKNHLNPKCNLLCNGYNDTSCMNLHIFAMNGTKSRNGIKFKCDSNNENICSKSRIYCNNDRLCDIKYNLFTNEWYCDGLCNNISIETVNSTKIHEKQDINTVSIWFALLNTTMVLTDDENNIDNNNGDNVLINNQYFNSYITLSIIGYILLGCVISGCLCCFCIVCFIICFVKYKINKREKNEYESYKKRQERNDSSVSIEYKEHKLNNQSSKGIKFGNVLISEIKSTINAVLGDDNNSEHSFTSLQNSDDTKNNAESVLDSASDKLSSLPTNQEKNTPPVNATNSLSLSPVSPKLYNDKYGNTLTVNENATVTKTNKLMKNGSFSVSIKNNTPSVSIHVSSVGNDDDAKLSEICDTDKGISYAESNNNYDNNYDNNYNKNYNNNSSESMGHHAQYTVYTDATDNDTLCISSIIMSNNNNNDCHIEVSGHSAPRTITSDDTSSTSSNSSNTSTTYYESSYDLSHKSYQ